MYGLIMAGGIGTRFWPRSRQDFPKQLLNIHGEKTMIQQTTDRLLHATDLDKIFIVCLPSHKNEILKQLPGLPAQNLIVEPLGKSTAPCIGLGALYIRRLDPDGVMAVLPSDHLIANEKHFSRQLNHAVELAKNNEALVTIGILPTYPATGYGYIQYRDEPIGNGDNRAFPVKSFAEKPDYETACRFLESGEFLWNSGVFVWKAEAILKEIEQHLPDMADGLYQIDKAIGTSAEAETIDLVYRQMRSISIDYGVMEQAERVLVLPGDFGWNDVGSWSEVYNIRRKDENKNVVDDRHIIVNSQGCLIESDKRVVAAVGIKNTIIVDTEDAILVCDRDHSQEVRKVIDQIKQKKMDHLL